MRFGRHMLFWLVYCTYFYIQSISPASLKEFSSSITYRNAFVSLCCFIPVCIMCVYVSIWYIFPKFIEPKKYLPAIFSFVLLFAFGTLINYFAAKSYYSISGSHAKGPLLLGYLNTIWAMIISGFAIGIKAVRKWFTEQKEISAITQNKTRNELNLQKNRMHPRFLYSSLHRIHESLINEDASSSRMILTLSNVLSYSLYESDNEFITLQNEIAAIEDFIALEKSADRQITLTVDEQLDTENLLVPPMIVFSSLQNSFLKMKDGDVSDCRTDIAIRRAADNILFQIRFMGNCAEKKVVEPVNVRVPVKYAATKMDLSYDTA